MNNKILLDTLLRKKTDLVPIWFMRQAGRYMREYKEIRNKCADFFELCYTPNLAAEVTLQPIRKFDFDGAIIFSDILVIPDLLGSQVTFLEKEGPKLSNKITTESDILKLVKAKNHRIHKVYEAIELTKSLLPVNKTLIGFAGSPWTLACYMVEGESSKNFVRTKTFAYTNPQIFQQLIDILVEETTEHLIRQIDSGVEAIQLFESWAGILNYQNFIKWVVEPNKKIIANLRKTYPLVPIIGFPKDAGSFYEDYINGTQVDAISLDSNYMLKKAVDKFPTNIVLQGNLDPCYLLTKDKSILDEQIELIFEQTKNKYFIFNLGHGILPETPIENVEYTLQRVRNFKR